MVLKLIPASALLAANHQNDKNNSLPKPRNFYVLFFMNVTQFHPCTTRCYKKLHSPSQNRQLYQKCLKAKKKTCTFVKKIDTLDI